MNPEAIAIEKLKTLSLSEQQEVLHFIEFLQSKASSKPQAAESTTEQPSSLSNAASKWIGSVEGNSDLSTNGNDLYALQGLQPYQYDDPFESATANADGKVIK
ncbi:MAG: DUF2281 domain-containing protein [Leptolyngbya sp. BL-A-14]